MNTYRLDQIVITGLIVMITAVLPIMDASNIGTRILIPLAVLYAFLRHSNKLRILGKPPLVYFVGLLIWSIFPNLLANNSDVAWITFLRMLIVLLYVYAISIFVSASDLNINVALRAFSVSSGIIFIQFLLSPEALDYKNNIEREYGLNANTYGYYAFIGLSSIFLLFSSGRMTLLRVLLLFGMGVLACIIQLMTASRGGFVISATFLIALVWTILQYKNMSFVSRFFSLILVSIFISLIGMVFSGFYQETLLFSRFTSFEYESIPRVLHAEEAWNLAVNSPIFGIGGGNYAVQFRFFEPGAFTHNGFLEVFVSFGIAGLALYAFMYVEYISALWRSRRNPNIAGFTFTTHILFLAGVLAYNFLYVPYLTTEFLPLLAVFRIKLQSEFRQKSGISR